MATHNSPATAQSGLEVSRSEHVLIFHRWSEVVIAAYGNIFLIVEHEFTNHSRGGKQIGWKTYLPSIWFNFEMPWNFPNPICCSCIPFKRIVCQILITKRVIRQLHGKLVACTSCAEVESSVREGWRFLSCTTAAAADMWLCFGH